MSHTRLVFVIKTKKRKERKSQPPLMLKDKMAYLSENKRCTAELKFLHASEYIGIYAMPWHSHHSEIKRIKPSSLINQVKRQRFSTLWISPPWLCHHDQIIKQPASKNKCQNLLRSKTQCNFKNLTQHLTLMCFRMITSTLSGWSKYHVWIQCFQFCIFMNFKRGFSRFKTYRLSISNKNGSTFEYFSLI